MLSELFKAPERIRAIRSGPSGALIEGFAEQLFRRGYAQTTARRHIRAAEHFVHWALRRGLCADDRDRRVLECFCLDLFEAKQRLVPAAPGHFHKLRVQRILTKYAVKVGSYLLASGANTPITLTQDGGSDEAHVKRAS